MRSGAIAWNADEVYVDWAQPCGLEKIVQLIKAFWDDTNGIILPYVTVMLVVIIGVSVLALDGARYMYLQTQLQNGADAVGACCGGRARPHANGD